LGLGSTKNQYSQKQGLNNHPINLTSQPIFRTSRQGNMKIIVKPFFLAVLGIIISAVPSVLNGQNPSQLSSNSSSRIAWLTPIEVIRNIDLILATTRLEALEAGRGDGFSAKINVAKSFVHAGENEDAKIAYGEALAIAWKRQIDHELLSKIENELDRSKKALVQDTKPIGLDENYHPTKGVSTFNQSTAALLDKYEAGKKIDEALSFIYLSMLRQQDQKLTLQGKLNHCRLLVELEEYEKAKKEYHSTIIAYLDPRWTSQLLEEIDGIINRIEPSYTHSEVHPNEVLTAERAIDEIHDIIKPITEYYEGNAVLSKGVGSMQSLIRKGEHEQALAEMRVTFTDFAPETWVDKNILRTKVILEKVENFNAPAMDNKTTRVAPSLYSKSEVEGRITETIRIVEDNELMTFKRVTHNWGGVYNFINDESAKDTEWIRVWKLYQEQEF